MGEGEISSIDDIFDRVREMAIPVAIVGGIKDRILAVSCEDAIETAFFRFASEHDLLAFVDIAWFAL